jgi:hypothetical protein
MSDMRTRPDIQQRAALARLSVQHEQRALHVRCMQQLKERAYNTAKYRENSLIDQMMASFDRWVRSVLG